MGHLDIANVQSAGPVATHKIPCLNPTASTGTSKSKNSDGIRRRTPDPHGVVPAAGDDHLPASHRTQRHRNHHTGVTGQRLTWPAGAGIPDPHRVVQLLETITSGQPPNPTPPQTPRRYDRRVRRCAVQECSPAFWLGRSSWFRSELNTWAGRRRWFSFIAGLGIRRRRAGPVAELAGTPGRCSWAQIATFVITGLLICDPRRRGARPAAPAGGRLVSRSCGSPGLRRSRYASRPITHKTCARRDRGRVELWHAG